MIFTVGAFVTVGWAVLLLLYGVTLRWVGFDLLLGAALAVTAALARRDDDRVSLMATAVATLVLTDTFFDLTTAHADYLPTALVMALTLEIPFALACLAYALRRHRHHHGPTHRAASPRGR
ncbi:hypothetical protein Airi02_087270 [Actinoallomurus iriomotensis]|uniref:Uncharacterized protein n=1 Tax=Actinoallomurus iriomotensis TaxID=478107 RepID=A0A9W6SC24_9ACTN|nr:hypothetical protein Airi02_087270 [Actinoallomurus iriomotensis]